MSRGIIKMHADRSCAGKRRHATRHDARAAAVAGRARGEVVREYACPFCGGWHIGHRHRRGVPGQRA